MVSAAATTSRSKVKTKGELGASGQPHQAGGQGKCGDYLHGHACAAPQSTRQHLVQDDHDHHGGAAERIDRHSVRRKRV